METDILTRKSYDFALKTIALVQHLQRSQKEFILSKQLMRSGSSIGANIQESKGAQSKKDFLHKISISYKEARETKYWLSLIKDSNYGGTQIVNQLLSDIEELLRILGSSKKTLEKSILSS